ncbi:hypothetical protein HYH03_004969 [Edaphochlamys debaryana]|uniref:D-alanyl-D-alanine carboxypeptidase-like core domain-containing protein n=1 Tax=Edaphochlamys debaryana TaxID=47281 RepID=A0A836C2Q6_9CHLO|nr:hypothetical protein HYH03_004969 [Edaphochlamys debaryana]|eukprot:KAG2496963.1 hypothetical protein HYH03_004969 [Edaphochlamys debaryana]
MLEWLGPWTLYGACPKFHSTLACCDTSVPGYSGCMRVYDCIRASPSSPPPPKIDNCTLGSIVQKGSPCSTDAVSRLSGQIAAEMGKLGVKLVPLSSDQKKHIECLYKEGCSGRMNPDALSSLVKVAKKKKKRITLKSMWRSAAQQYLLYRFHATGKCDQKYVVDRPGNSAHEGGAAIDVKRETVSTWAFALMTEHWKWPLPSSDPVHFAYQSTSKAHSKYSLIAFQRLWNRHNPESRIAEDGHYGKETEAALSKTPCKGW